MLVLPISFTCEHIETLHELDVELAEVARSAGIEEFVRAPALNLDEGWLVSLSDHITAAAFALQSHRFQLTRQGTSYA